MVGATGFEPEAPFQLNSSIVMKWPFLLAKMRSANFGLMNQHDGLRKDYVSDLSARSKGSKASHREMLGSGIASFGRMAAAFEINLNSL